MTLPPHSESPRARPSLRPSLESGPWFALALALVTGIAAGVGGFTFRYANGLSYLSSNPVACVNCHIMQSQFAGWQHSSHRSVAVCVDCHLPHALIPKYLAKAENGFRHARLFTSQTFSEPIFVKERGQQILQENCVRCHESMVHGLVSYEKSPARSVKCVHCHEGVGHVQRAGLGGPLRPDEIAAAEASARTSEAARRPHER